jgi:hypothetical protein
VPNNLFSSYPLDLHTFPSEEKRNFGLSFGFILRERAVEVRGIPHLAKNERDMGHPKLVCRDRMRNSQFSRSR